MTEQEFAGRVALVTGAASGIGRASALALAAEGASVMVADLNAAGAAETVALIEAAGGLADSVEADVTDERAVAAMVAATVDRFGGLDIAHNNAGASGRSTRITETDLDNWNLIIGANLTSVFLCLREELRIMSAQGSGVIVNTASVSSRTGQATLAAYGAAKHGVSGLTKAAAMEHAGQGIRINAVAPGFTRTPMIEQEMAENPVWATSALDAIPLGRGARPEEIADVVVWLCSRRSSFVVGQTIYSDGGVTVGRKVRAPQ
ncbi:SDR family oxidoreductase [Nocardioides sp. LMS-CY]|uniref:SDR family NAD(P)-dependent oxidoreductase n=1 Tax=Nocardioides sp. (strain LMS-CY) TaxID=2840457 RepID=UPI001BFFEBC6|nr:SDR family oxidoreductase [Nocardioides sp. LMS-CY]QWF21276.1 SDR family oxidoreductase [Nocardioides sp. LMS-CY]